MFLALWDMTSSTIVVMVNQGYGVDSYEDTGATLLLRCVLERRRDLMKALLDCGANPNLGLRNREDGLPIRMSTYFNRFDYVKLLVDYGAMVTTIEDMCDSIKSVFNAGNTDLIEFLLDCGLNPNMTFRDVSNLINVATKMGYDDLVEVLLELGADIHNRDSSMHTCIFHAVIHKNLHLVQLFLHAGAEVNMHDNQGVYLLGYAVVSGHIDITNELIRAGASLYEMDTTNVHCNAAQLAIITNKWEILDLVSEYEIDLSGQNRRQENILDTCLLVIKKEDVTPDTGTLLFRRLIRHGATAQSMKEYPHMPKDFFTYCTRTLADMAFEHQLQPRLTAEEYEYPSILYEAYHNKDVGLLAHLAAVQRGLASVVSLLLVSGANPNDHNPMRPVYLAEVFMQTIKDASISSDNKFSILTMLLDRGMGLEMVELYPSIPFEVMQVIELRLLLLLLANDGETVVMTKARNTDVHLQNLIDFGGDPNDTNGQHQDLVNSEYNQDLRKLFKKSALTNAMYDVQVTDNFKLIFALSSSSNIATAYALAGKINLPEYQEYIGTRMALIHGRQPHHAYKKMLRVFEEDFRIPYNSFRPDLGAFLRKEYAGGIS
ncbi:hypothetical protein QAD02_011668 [Eretmocerus hayati]|uniref:Uncharacterized protein n=1 Tax=Eretmocerus hayati TaxID=131215 RepID=A0ACC2P0A8_9HYME|nr:hypothetical protein QAD02_011668 [Eretmocerus hayati]